MLLMGGVLLHLCVFGAIMWPRKERKVSTQTNSKDDNAAATVSECDILRRLFTNWQFLVLCICSFLFGVGFSVFFAYMPAYSRQCIGLNEFQMSVLVSSIGIANMVSRLILGAILDLQCVNSQLVFMISYAGLGIVTIFMPFASTYVWMIVFCVLFGATYAAYGPCLSVVTLLYTGKETYVSGYGYVCLISGIGSMAGASVAGKFSLFTPNKH